MALRFKVNPITGLLDAVSEAAFPPIPTAKVTWSVVLASQVLNNGDNVVNTGCLNCEVSEITLFITASGDEFYEANLVNTNPVTGDITINVALLAPETFDIHLLLYKL